jgi:hypothetical protein
VPSTSKSLKSAIIFVWLFASLLYLIYLTIKADSPLRELLAGTSMQVKMEENFAAEDEKFKTDAAGENLEMYFEGFDVADVRQGLLMCQFYFRAVYAICPQRAIIGHGDSIINLQSQLAAADTVPDDIWLKANNVHHVLTIHRLPNGAIDDSDLRTVR